MILVFSARSRVSEDIQGATVTDSARMHALTSQTTQTSHVCDLPLMAPCGRGCWHLVGGSIGCKSMGRKRKEDNELD